MCDPPQGEPPPGDTNMEIDEFNKLNEAGKRKRPQTLTTEETNPQRVKWTDWEDPLEGTSTAFQDRDPNLTEQNTVICIKSAENLPIFNKPKLTSDLLKCFTLWQIHCT